MFCYPKFGFVSYRCQPELRSYDRNLTLSVIQESSSQCLIRKNFPKKIHIHGTQSQAFLKGLNNKAVLCKVHLHAILN
jgi:hypothetical protein